MYVGYFSSLCQLFYENIDNVLFLNSNLDIHFQYNGFLFGMLFLSIVKMFKVLWKIQYNNISYYMGQLAALPPLNQTGSGNMSHCRGLNM